MGGKLDDLAYWQKSPLASSIREAYASKPSTIAAETWLVFDKPQNLTTDQLNLALYRSCTAFSTMKGLLVYSESLKKMETFIYDSYRIDNPQSKLPLPDPDVTSMPESAKFFLYQKEEQTGDVYSEMNIQARAGQVAVSLKNQSPMSYLFFTLVQPGDLGTSFFLVPAQDKIILYGITVARTPSLLGLEKLKRSSFSNRMQALAGWIRKNLQR